MVMLGFVCGIRSTAFAKNVSSSGGISEVSISSSDIASTRFQSVRDGFFIGFPFMLHSLPQGDDPGYFSGGSFCKDHHNDPPVKGTDTDPSVLAVVFSIVFPDEHGRFEDVRRIREV